MAGNCIHYKPYQKMHRTQQDLHDFKAYLCGVYDAHYNARKDGDDDGKAMSQLLVTAAKGYLTKAPWLAQSDREELVEDLGDVHDELRGGQTPYTYLYDNEVLHGILDSIESFFDEFDSLESWEGASCR